MIEKIEKIHIGRMVYYTAVFQKKSIAGESPSWHVKELHDPKSGVLIGIRSIQIASQSEPVDIALVSKGLRQSVRAPFDSLEFAFESNTGSGSLPAEISENKAYYITDFPEPEYVK